MSNMPTIKFRNIRTITQSGAPVFFVEDISAHFFLKAEDCHDVIKKFGHVVVARGAEGIVEWGVCFEGFQALVALSAYTVGGDPKDLQRYQELMAS